MSFNYYYLDQVIEANGVLQQDLPVPGKNLIAEQIQKLGKKVKQDLNNYYQNGIPVTIPDIYNRNLNLISPKLEIESLIKNTSLWGIKDNDLKETLLKSFSLGWQDFEDYFKFAENHLHCFRKKERLFNQESIELLNRLSENTIDFLGASALKQDFITIPSDLEREIRQDLNMLIKNKYCFLIDTTRDAQAYRTTSSLSKLCLNSLKIHKEYYDLGSEIYKQENESERVLSELYTNLHEYSIRLLINIIVTLPINYEIPLNFSLSGLLGHDFVDYPHKCKALGLTIPVEDVKFFDFKVSAAVTTLLGVNIGNLIQNRSSAIIEYGDILQELLERDPQDLLQKFTPEKWLPIFNGKIFEFNLVNLLRTSSYFSKLSDEMKLKITKQANPILNYLHGNVQESQVGIERIILKNLKHESIQNGIQKYLHFRGPYRKWIIEEHNKAG